MLPGGASGLSGHVTNDAAFLYAEAEPIPRGSYVVPKYGTRVYLALSKTRSAVTYSNPLLVKLELLLHKRLFG